MSDRVSLYDRLVEALSASELSDQDLAPILAVMHHDVGSGTYSCDCGRTYRGKKARIRCMRHVQHCRIRQLALRRWRKRCAAAQQG